MAENVRLLPPEGRSSLSIAILSGHSICIYGVFPEDGKPGTPVPVKFRKQALEAGCNPVGFTVEDEEADPDTKSALILKAIEAIVERNNADDFNGDGRPSLKTVKAQVGFGLTASELNAAWESFEKSLG